jgi:hypothetical protein
MSKVRFNSVIVLCAALAACSDSATRAVTAPGAGPSLSEASADVGASYTIDGSSELDLATEEASAPFALMASAQLLGAELAASPNAASGPRGTGHVGIYFPANPGIVSEKYSFVALRTDPATPLAAKGQYEVQYTTGSGIEIRIQGDVDCMTAFQGNPGPFAGATARASGPIRRVWRNNVPSPITAATHAFWVVVDNGEGQPIPPDFVSLVNFAPAGIAQNFCANGFGINVFPNQEGNVQVELN